MHRRISIVLALWACAGAVQADTLVLANGDTLNCEIVSWDLDSVLIDHPQLGRMRLDLTQLEIDTGKMPSPGLFGSNFLRGWKRSIDLGVNGTMGNSENANLKLGLNFKYDDAFKRWRLNGRYFLNADEDGVSDNNGQANLTRDWLVPESRWFGRTGFRYQYDQFESWEHRLTLNTGPGYNLLDRGRHRLDVSGGGAYVKELGDRNTDKGLGWLGFEYELKATGRITVTLSNTFFVEAVPTAGEIRNLTDGELKVALFEEPALSLKLGAQNEYETDVDPGDKKNDLKYWLSLGLDF